MDLKNITNFEHLFKKNCVFDNKDEIYKDITELTAKEVKQKYSDSVFVPHEKAVVDDKLILTNFRIMKTLHSLSQPKFPLSLNKISEALKGIKVGDQFVVFLKFQTFPSYRDEVSIFSKVFEVTSLDNGKLKVKIVTEVGFFSTWTATLLIGAVAVLLLAASIYFTRDTSGMISKNKQSKVE